MSKIIKLTKEYIDKAREDFEKMISEGKFSEGKISFTKTFDDIKRRATVYFTDMAWLKMTTLVQEFNKEVAWHGVVERGEEDDSYVVSDIIVYPQRVTGATVDMDTEKYGQWLNDNIEDDRFFNLYLQGHSHVNMSTFASATDKTHQDIILSQLPNDKFYIFIILNKKGDCYIKVYDLASNIMFETKDVDIKIIGTDLKEWLKENKKMVEDFVSQNNKPSSTPFKSETLPATTTTTSNQTKTQSKSDKKSGSKKYKGKKRGSSGGYSNGFSSGYTSWGSGYYDGYYSEDYLYD